MVPTRKHHNFWRKQRKWAFQVWITTKIKRIATKYMRYGSQRLALAELVATHYTTDVAMTKRANFYLGIPHYFLENYDAAKDHLVNTQLHSITSRPSCISRLGCRAITWVALSKHIIQKKWLEYTSHLLNIFKKCIKVCVALHF